MTSMRSRETRKSIGGSVGVRRVAIPSLWREAGGEGGGIAHHRHKIDVHFSVVRKEVQCYVGGGGVRISFFALI